jgi:hypothetical protein
LIWSFLTPETKRSKYTTAQIETILGKKSPAKMMNKETNAPDSSSKNSPPKSGPIPTGSSSSPENEEHALLTLSRMNLPMAPDVDLATVPLIPLSRSLLDEYHNRPETEEDGIRAEAIRKEQVRRLTVPREKKAPPGQTPDL